MHKSTIVGTKSECTIVHLCTRVVLVRCQPRNTFDGTFWKNKLSVVSYNSMRSTRVQMKVFELQSKMHAPPATARNLHRSAGAARHSAPLLPISSSVQLAQHTASRWTCARKEWFAHTHSHSATRPWAVRARRQRTMGRRKWCRCESHGCGLVQPHGKQWSLTTVKAHSDEDAALHKKQPLSKKRNRTPPQR